MPTLDDLHAVLADRERFAPESSSVLDGLENPPSRKGITTPLLAAAAVVALAGGALYVAAPDDPSTSAPAAGGPAAPLSWTFRVGAVDGFTVDRVAATEESDLAKAVSTETGGPKAFITVYAPGVAPKGDLPRIDATIHGHDAYFQGGSSPVDMDGTSMADAWNDPDHFARLRWQDDSGSWVEVEGTLGYHPQTATYDNDEALDLAEHLAAAVHVTPRADDPVTMPLALQDVPDGLAPFAANPGPPSLCIDYASDVASADFANPDLTACRVATGTVDPSYSAQDLRVTRDLGDGTTLVVQSDVLSEADLNRLADEANVSPSLDDTSTWLPVR